MKLGKALLDRGALSLWEDRHEYLRVLTIGAHQHLLEGNEEARTKFLMSEKRTDLTMEILRTLGRMRHSKTQRSEFKA